MDGENRWKFFFSFSCERIGWDFFFFFFKKKGPRGFFSLFYLKRGEGRHRREVSATPRPKGREKKPNVFSFLWRTRLFFYIWPEKKAFAAILNQKLKTSRKYLEVFLFSHNWTQDDDDCMNCMNKKMKWGDSWEKKFIFLSRSPPLVFLYYIPTIETPVVWGWSNQPLVVFGYFPSATIFLIGKYFNIPLWAMNNVHPAWKFRPIFLLQPWSIQRAMGFVHCKSVSMFTKKMKRNIFISFFLLFFLPFYYKGLAMPPHLAAISLSCWTMSFDSTDVSHAFRLARRTHIFFFPLYFFNQIIYFFFLN